MEQQRRLAPNERIHRILEIAANGIEDASDKGFDIVELNLVPSQRKFPLMPKYGKPIPVAGNERKCSILVPLGTSPILPGKQGTPSGTEKCEDASPHIKAMLERGGLAWNETEDGKLVIALEDRQR